MKPVVVDASTTGEPTVTVLPAPQLVPPPRSPLGGTPLHPPPQVPRPVVAGGRHAMPDPPAVERRWVDHLLTVLALVGVAMTLLTVVAARSGLQPLVVRSGSMEPAIRTGAMVLVREVPASELRVGEVVAVQRPDRTRVTHRIVSIERQGATSELVLKGDANSDPDPHPVVVAKAGRVVASVSWLGRVGGLVASAKGGFVLGWVVAVITLSVVRRRRS